MSRFYSLFSQYKMERATKSWDILLQRLYHSVVVTLYNFVLWLGSVTKQIYCNAMLWCHSSVAVWIFIHHCFFLPHFFAAGKQQKNLYFLYPSSKQLKCKKFHNRHTILHFHAYLESSYKLVNHITTGSLRYIPWYLFKAIFVY